MPQTYFKCVDTLLAYCNKSKPKEPSLWFVKLSLSKFEILWNLCFYIIFTLGYLVGF